MKTIQVNLYQYDELNEKAKEKALEWFARASEGDEWWSQVYEDAEQAGIKIKGFDIDRGNDIKGEFIHDACHTAHFIEKEHGEECETFKTAKAFLAERDAIVNGAEKDENGDFVDEYAVDAKLDDCEKEFLESILKDYLSNLSKEYEYISSREYMEENIRLNEYDFTESGKIA